MASATVPVRSESVLLPSDAHAWDTGRLTDEAVRAIQSCRKYGQAAAKNAWQAGAYLSLLHARLVKGRKWAAWLRRHEEVVSEDTARRYILLYERTRDRAALDGMTLTEAYAAFGITRFTEAAPVETGSNGDGPIHRLVGSGADHRRQPLHDTPVLNGHNGEHQHPLIPNDLEEPGDPLAGIDEKAILRATKEIRQRQIAERLLRQREREEAARAGRQGKRAWVVTADQRVAGCHAVIADPPYGISKAAWEPEDLEGFTRDWCGRWSDSGADLVAIFWSQAKMFEGRRWFDESLAGYTFQQVLIGHASNSLAPKSRKRFKESWEPIFLYRRRGSDRLIFTRDKAWGGGLHNLDCQVAPVPEGNYRGVDLKQHPAQKPLSVMRWLVHALTEPGEKVASPFCGVAPCGVAAVQLGRRYHGIEIDERYRKIAEGRIAMYGTA